MLNSVLSTIMLCHVRRSKRNVSVKNDFKQVFFLLNDLQIVAALQASLDLDTKKYIILQLQLW